MTAFHNAHWPDARPALSVLIPFLSDDPTPLLQALAKEATGLGSEVEVILLDDGTGDPALTGRITALVARAAMPICLITAASNNGRAAGRNILLNRARGEYVLFIDADMLPDNRDFLSQWLYFAREERPAAAFGGFSVSQAPTDPRFAVHRAMALRTDCLDAKTRARDPLKNVFTSNLLIRREHLATCPFDGRFSGWGWEDVEWAIRFGKAHTIRHVDIPATHMGLDDVPTLMRKYDQSARNFEQIRAAHPEVVEEFPSFKVAKLINCMKIAPLVIRLSQRMAMWDSVPVFFRGLSLRFYRAARYAEAMQGS
ncbi:glycosyltransferase [uncultured Brevundimonas sp.]|uniref:glycosyltransferase family 2 protein n=1 Tax=uncultured Brevundimonas sp. TaxID=213418 RepID=UPI00261AA406|nr:glycosyltransferase [uncultured Brevundimonas sp.]